MINNELVKESQETWGNGVVKIGSLKEDRSACEEYASEFLDNLYAFEMHKLGHEFLDLIVSLSVILAMY